MNPRVAITPLYAPAYTGSYEYGTTIQMVNVATGAVIGTAIVAEERPSTRCTSRRRWPSANTIWRSEAVDEVGHVGHASRVFGLQVVPPKKHRA